MNKRITITREGKSQTILLRQAAHDKLVTVGSKFKYGSGRAWIVTVIEEVS